MLTRFNNSVSKDLYVQDVVDMRRMYPTSLECDESESRLKGEITQASMQRVWVCVFTALHVLEIWIIIRAFTSQKLS